MRTRNGADESRAGGESSVAGTEAGDDRLHPIDGGSTGAVSRGRTQAQDIDDCTTFGGHYGAGTTAIKEAPWFEPVIDNGCKDGVCPVPWATTKPEVKTLPWVTTPSRPELQPDLVNHPPHYTDGSIECIDAIEAQLTPEEFRGYLKGSIAKYNWRERHKGGTESLKKARFYLDRLIMFDEN
jgi:hypothetical protein